MKPAILHDVGHVLGIGWADDAPLPIPVAGKVVNRGLEVYSGNGDPAKAGGVDLTNETITVNGNPDNSWSIMARGAAEDARGLTNQAAGFPLLPFSIEELSTVDFEDIPSKSDD